MRNLFSLFCLITSLLCAAVLVYTVFNGFLLLNASGLKTSGDYALAVLISTFLGQLLFKGVK